MRTAGPLVGRRTGMRWEREREKKKKKERERDYIMRIEIHGNGADMLASGKYLSRWAKPALDDCNLILASHDCLP